MFCFVTTKRFAFLRHSYIVFRVSERCLQFCRFFKHKKLRRFNLFLGSLMKYKKENCFFNDFKHFTTKVFWVIHLFYLHFVLLPLFCNMKIITSSLYFHKGPIFSLMEVTSLFLSVRLYSSRGKMHFLQEFVQKCTFCSIFAR